LALTLITLPALLLLVEWRSDALKETELN
jgi:hypothetical protein